MAGRQNAPICDHLRVHTKLLKLLTSLLISTWLLFGAVSVQFASTHIRCPLYAILLPDLSVNTKEVSPGIWATLIGSPGLIVTVCVGVMTLT